MLLIEAAGLKKYYRDRLIFTIDDLKIYDQERIGIIGINGAGKTTLLNILSGRDHRYEGTVRLNGQCAYITQLESTDLKEADSGTETMSGGEKTRLKIAQQLNTGSLILLADEPTSSLDLPGVGMLEKELKEYPGALILITHDRRLMDAVCTKILEIEEGVITQYPGNYSDYKRQKEEKTKRQQFEYEQYIKERKRLIASYYEVKQRVKAMRPTPVRMGNSEARLHKRGVGGKQAKLDKAAKALETRINQLGKKEKPIIQDKAVFDQAKRHNIRGKMVLCAENLNKSWGQKVLFQGGSFQVAYGKKVALIGDNGTGKSTLFKMIINQEEGIRTAGSSGIGYFSQELNQLDKQKSILENVSRDAVLSPEEIRLMLARLLFKRDDVYKTVGVLSGGERVKTTLAKLLAGGQSLLLLDEPTNYLDVSTLEALEDLINEYEGTVLFVTHDRAFIENTAEEVIVIKNHHLVHYMGKYSEYLESLILREQEIEKKNKIMCLENRLSEIMGQLCLATSKEKYDALDIEYKMTLRALKEAKLH